MVRDFESRYEEANERLARWVNEGGIEYEETITEGFGNAPTAFIGLFEGENVGKQLVKVGARNDPSGSPIERSVRIQRGSQARIGRRWTPRTVLSVSVRDPVVRGGVAGVPGDALRLESGTLFAPVIYYIDDRRHREISHPIGRPVEGVVCILDRRR